MEQIDYVFMTIKPKMSDYICLLASVMVILQHIKIAIIQWKKFGVDVNL